MNEDLRSNNGRAAALHLSAAHGRLPSMSASAGPLPDGSVDAVRAALRHVAPALADEPIELGPRIDNNPPLYWRGSARVGRDWMVKFAWSPEAAVGIAQELRLLTILPAVVPAVPLPQLVQQSLDPLLFVTRYVDGVPLGFDPDHRETPTSPVPEQLAEALAHLHQPGVRDVVEDHGVHLGTPVPQSSTAMLRERFAGPIVTGSRARLTLEWCEWVDEALERDVEPVLLHGDLHGHNVVVSAEWTELLLVADFENSYFGDPAYDFRYLPSLRPDLAWFHRMVNHYNAVSGRHLSMDRIVAWHIRTALGDALWRTERGVPLPQAPTPEHYVDDVAWRMDALGVGPGR